MFVSCQSFGFFAIVHDNLAQLYRMIQLQQNSLYQRLDIKSSLEAIGLSQKNLKTVTENLKVAKEDLMEAKKIYSKGVELYSAVGDPKALTAYLNAEVVHLDWIDESLDIFNKTESGQFNINDYDSAVTNINAVEHMLMLSEENMETVFEGQKTTEAALVAIKGKVEKEKKAAQELANLDKKYDPRRGSINDTTYANYKVNTFNSSVAVRKSISDLQYQKAHLSEIKMWEKLCKEQEESDRRDLLARKNELKNLKKDPGQQEKNLVKARNQYGMGIRSIGYRGSI